MGIFFWAPIAVNHYLIEPGYVLDLCKMMTSRDAFFIFLKFWFSWLLRGKNSKTWSKMTKNYVCLTSYLGNCTSYNCGFWYTCIKWWYLQHFFSFFQNTDISGFYEGMVKEGQKMTHNFQFQPVTLYISRTVDHIMKIVGIHLQVLLFIYFYYYFFSIFGNIKVRAFLLAHFNSFFNK